MALSIERAKALVIEFCAEYPVASKISFKIRNTQEEALDEPRATIERAGRIYGAYFPGRGYAAFAVSNFRDEDDFKRALRHEILGHFGINTFKPEEKRAILDRLIEARNEPAIAQIWVEVDRAYVGMSELRKAEEVFAFACETIEPHLRLNATAGVKSFDDTCLSGNRPLTLADLDNITTMVAVGLHNRSRSQQTFPDSDSAQFSKIVTQYSSPALSISPEFIMVGNNSSEVQIEIEPKDATNNSEVNAVESSTEKENSFLVEDHLKTLESWGGVEVELVMAEPVTAKDRAEFHAAQIVSGSDWTDEGKSLIADLMKYELYRDYFKKSALVFYEETKGPLIETGYKIAEELIRDAEKLYGVAPSKSDAAYTIDELNKLNEMYGSTLIVIPQPELQIKNEPLTFEVRDKNLGFIGVFQGDYDDVYRYGLIKAGEKENSQTAKQTITNATYGLVTEKLPGESDQPTQTRQNDMSELPNNSATPSDNAGTSDSPIEHPQVPSSPLEVAEQRNDQPPLPLNFTFNGQPASLNLQDHRPGQLPEPTVIRPIERSAPPMPNLTYNGQPAHLHAETAWDVRDESVSAPVSPEVRLPGEPTASQPNPELGHPETAIAADPVPTLTEVTEAPAEVVLNDQSDVANSGVPGKPTILAMPISAPADRALPAIAEPTSQAQTAEAPADVKGLTSDQLQWAQSQPWFNGSGHDDDGAYVFARELNGKQVQWMFRNAEELKTWAEKQRPPKPKAIDLPAARPSVTVDLAHPENSTDAIHVGARIGKDEPQLQSGFIDKDVLLTRLTREPQADQSVLYKLDNQPAFVDRGSRLEMVPGAGQSDEKIMAALLIAAKWFRGEIELTGSDAFKSKAIELIALHRVNVSMKNPVQQLMLDQARQALDVPAVKPDAILGNTPPPFDPAPPVVQAAAPTHVDEPRTAVDPVQPASTVATRDVAPDMSHLLYVPDFAPQSFDAAQHGPVDDATPLGGSMQSPAAAEAIAVKHSEVSPAVHQQSKAAEQGVTGKVLSCGIAPFRFDEQNTASVHIKLRTKEGIQTFWGKELAGLLRESRIQPGRMVTLQWLGNKDVVVKAPVKDPDTGVVIRYEEKNTRRNQWSMSLLNGPTVRTGDDLGVKLTAYDAARFEMIQHSVIAQLAVQIDAPPRPADGLFWMTPNGQGSAKAGDELSAARPAVDTAEVGKPVLSSWSADGHLDMALFRGDGPYLQGVVRQGDSYQHVLVSLPGSADAPPMVFNAITEQGLVPIGVGNGINRSSGEPVAREHVAFKLEGDKATRIAKLDFPAELPPALHARLGFDERWKDTNTLPKSSPAAAPKAEPSAVRPS